MPTVSEIIVQILLKRLREEPLTPEEEATLAAWEAESPEHGALVSRLMNEELLHEKIRQLLMQDEQAAWERISKAIEAEELAPVKKMNWIRYSVAAAIVVTVIGSTYYFISRQSTTKATPGTDKPVIVADLPPGGDKAVLILSDGRRLDLTEMGNGTLAEQEGAKVVKRADGWLVYQRENKKGHAAVQYNTLQTPKGGQYQLKLPDGTQVWLNAASSITYPTAFTGNERIVEMTGEAYFAVTPDAKKKFRVFINGSSEPGRPHRGPGGRMGEARVLGTEFNIKAYSDERCTTTLLSGRVEVSAEQASDRPDARDFTRLDPGQQARWGNNKDLTIIRNADIDHAVAWKNGYTSFKDANLETIMREISRWYNVEVIYVGPVNKSISITGDAPRNTSLATLIKVLQLTDVNIRIEEGNKLIIEP